MDILTHKRWCNHCRDHVDHLTHANTCSFAALQKKFEMLSNVANRVYWAIEVGDRITALKELAPYAKPRDPDAPHWLTSKSSKTGTS